MPRQKPSAPELDACLDEAADAFDRGDLEATLALAHRALALDPHSVEALHFRAAVLAEQGDVEGARERYLEALRVAPDAPELLLGAADLLISRCGEEREDLTRGLELAARGRKLAKKSDDTELLAELTLLEGIALNQLGEGKAALQRLDEALALSPGSVDALLERGLANFELCRFEDARRDLERVTELCPDEAWAQHYLGLVAERTGNDREAKRRFARATELSAEDFPEPVLLSEEAFDKAVEDAVAKLPAHVKQYLENTTIAVEPYPSADDLIAEDPPLSPCILGVFRGTPVGERSVANAADHQTASIVLYQKNLERFARGNRSELIDQIGITLMHEVGHLIGLDEEDLWERGLD